jgi:mRNA interferase RelE/StbE
MPMSRSEIEDALNKALAPYRTIVRFGKGAAQDLKHFPKATQKEILALILARAKKGALLKPDGIGEPLHGPLSGFSKIKPKHLALRIVYRPRRDGDQVIMEIIAIGPRDRSEVYKLAAARVLEFQREMREEE